MKNLINSVSMKLALKSLSANGSLKNVHFKVGGNILHIEEIIFVDNNKGSKTNFSFSKEKGGNIEVSSSHDAKIEVKKLSIYGDKGEEFVIEFLELNSVAEGMELFASIMK